jgi:DNA-binding LytR/AlgR family response regulator
LVIDPDREEEIVVYAHSPSALTERIEQIAKEPSELMGYAADRMVPITAAEVCCFAVEDHKVYACLPQERLLVKLRLYQLEEQFSHEFIKINQPCLANVHKILRFEGSVGGSLRVIFEGGYSDYVSRRQLKAVKERFGI